MNLKRGSRLLMIGDSVTDCNRNYNASLASNESFGNGYVNIVNALLTGLAPEKRITVINKGISGNTVLDLHNRWQEDVIDLKPDYVSVMIGINDVWRHFDKILQPVNLVDEALFESTYIKLIEQTKPVVEELYILSPFMMMEEKEYPMRKMVERYADIARRLAEQFGVVYVDVQSAMDEFMKELPAYTISSDHVHPYIQGHAIIAKTFLDAIGFEWR